MSKTLRTFLLFISNLFLMGSLVVVAQAPPKPKSFLLPAKDTLSDPDLLEGVTVIGMMSVVRTKQSSQPLTLIKKADFNQQSATNVIDALTRLVPGLTALTTGPAISKPIIRGLGYNRILTLNDGVRQEGQQWGDEHGIEIDEASVQKAEVLKGPASLLYGSDGMGGVIHLISNLPLPKGTRSALVQTGYQSNNGLWSVHAAMGAHQNNGFNWRVYGSGKSAGDYRNAADGKVLNSRFLERNYGGYLGWNRAWGYSHLLFSSFHQNLGVVEGVRDSLTGDFLLFGGTSVQRRASGDDLKGRKPWTPDQLIRHQKITWDNNLKWGRGRLMANMAYQRNRREEFDDPFNPRQQALFFDLQTLTYRLHYQWDEKKGWKTAAGFSGMYQQNANRAEQVLIPAYRQLDLGFFVFTRKSFSNKLQVSAGLRADRRNLQSDAIKNNLGQTSVAALDRHFGNWSGSVGFAYALDEHWTVKGNLSRGFRAPVVSELASNGSHAGTGRFEYGDPALLSEVSVQGDAGLEWSQSNFTLGLSFFYNHLNRYTFYRRLANAAGNDSMVLYNGEWLEAFQYDQAPARLFGLEGQWHWHPQNVPGLKWNNSFQYVRGQLTQPIEGSTDLPFMPPARWISEWRYEWSAKKAGAAKSYAKIEWEGVATQNKVFTAYNTETRTAGYGLVNLGWGVEWKGKKDNVVSLHLSINNLFDVAYQNHLSRLKYTDFNPANGRTGVINMGRNFGIKCIVPFVW